MSGYNAILAIGVLIFALAIGMTYGISALGAVDGTQNMTGSPYEGQYNSTVDASITSFSMVQYMPLVLAVFAIVAAMVMMRKII